MQFAAQNTARQGYGGGYGSGSGSGSSGGRGGVFKFRYVEGAGKKHNSTSWQTYNSMSYGNTKIFETKKSLDPMTNTQYWHRTYYSKDTHHVTLHRNREGGPNILFVTRKDKNGEKIGKAERC